MCIFTWRQERDSELSFPNPTNFRVICPPFLSRVLQEIKLQPGQFPRGVKEAGVETKNTPQPGKPSEMGLVMTFPHTTLAV